MAGDHINLITCNRFGELYRWLAYNYALAQLAGHLLHIVYIQVQFLGDLAIGQIEPHEIQAQNPRLQWLMMPFENRTGQVIEIPATGFTAIPLSFRLGFVPTVFDHRIGITAHTPNALGPAQFTNRLKTFGRIDDGSDMEYIVNCVPPLFH
jgi:hypothetical protein